VTPAVIEVPDYIRILNFSIASGPTGVKKLTRFPSGSRNRSYPIDVVVLVASLEPQADGARSNSLRDAPAIAGRDRRRDDDAVSSIARAQDEFEIQVYDVETA
jgi:hypothetical protein